MNKKHIIKGLVILNVGAIIAKLLIYIPSPKIDESITVFAKKMMAYDGMIGVQNWLIYFITACAILCSYFTAKEKIIKGGKK